jgi:uncharacterized protein YciI
MFFIILAQDKPNALEQRLAHRQAHLDYWNGLAGCVQIAGAQLTSDAADATPKGSAFVIVAEDLTQARHLVDQDPFSRLGIFADIRIEAFRPAIGAWKPV